MDKLFDRNAISNKYLNYLAAVGGLPRLPQTRFAYKLSSFFKWAIISLDS